MNICANVHFYYYSGTLHYHLNENQDGTFGSALLLDDLIPGEAVEYGEASMVDMDQDGDLDIVTCFEILSQGNFYLTWAENIDNTGTFSSPNIITSFPLPVGDIGFYDFQVEDLNGDAKTDVILFSGSGKVIYYQITGTVWNEQPLNDITSSWPMAMADIDNDGDIDILSQDHTSVEWNMMLYLNDNNSGNFTPSVIPNYLDLDPRNEYQLEDFDNDGDIDISFVNRDYSDGPKGVYLMKNDLTTTANFTEIYKIDDVVQGFIKPFPLDLDGDEDNDLIIFSANDQSHFWLENLDGTNEFSSHHQIIPNQEISISEVADLDSDSDGDIIGINDDQELVWYENISSSSVAFGPKQIITVNVDPRSLIVEDFDNDGDFDIGIHKTSTAYISWYEQDAAGGFSEHFVANPGTNAEMLHFGDFDNDGLKDILYTDVVNGADQLSYFKQETDGSFTSVLLYEGTVLEAEIADLGNDFDLDIVIKYNEGSGFLLKVLLNEGGSHSTHQITFDPITFAPDYMKDFILVDIDSDGKKDIFFGGRYYHKQLVDEINFSPRILLDGQAWYGIVAAADLSDDGIVDFIATRTWDGLAWDENLIGEGVWVEGQVALDLDDNCLLDSSTVHTWLLSFEQNGETYYTSTNVNGYYAAFLPEAGEYTANVLLPNVYWNSCVVDQVISVDSTTSLDFPIQVNFECPLMQSEVSSGPLRPCMPGAIWVDYCNEGTTTAENATVEVLLDEVLLFNSASLPYTETDSSYLFEVGNLDFFECGEIQISVTPECDSTELGDIVCATSYVRPDSLCVPTGSLWDGSNIEASGFCANDTVFFELKNVGIGNMSESRQFRIEIANDDIVLLIIADTFLLEIEETKLIAVPATTDPLRIEADQDENHPTLTAASALVTDCADFEIPIDLFAIYSGNPFSYTYCTALTASFDPNAKSVTPTGYGDENFIDRTWELNYTIQFQNTGNDTAFNVVLKDMISPHLDLSTLKVGASSHPFTWSLATNRELEFSFNNILLPDSTTNEAASQGYVKFSITPMPDAPFGTLIENRVDIYFDFNEPIATNKTSQTIRTPIFATSEHLDVCEGEELASVIITEDQMIVDSMLTTAYGIMTMDGRLVKRMEFSSGGLGNPLEISMGDLASGVYWLRLDFLRGNVFYRVVKM